MRQYESSAWEVGTGSAPVRCEPAGCLPSGRSTGPPRSNGAARVQGPGFVHVPYHGHQPRRKPGAGAATARTEQVKPCSRPWSGARSAAQRCSVLSSARPWGLPASGGASPQSRVILVPDHPGCRCFAIGSGGGEPDPCGPHDDITDDFSSGERQRWNSPHVCIRDMAGLSGGPLV